MTRVRRIPLRLSGAAILVLLAAFVTGCMNFEQRWREAANRLLPEDTIAGRWDGHWESEETSARGRLRCIATPLKDGSFEARFLAVYAGFIPFEHTMHLRGANRGGSWHVVGQEDLGWLAGGVYTYDGNVSADRFFATYVSADDKGTFEMERAD